MINRCVWSDNHPLYIDYHDKEWGVPVYNDHITDCFRYKEVME